MLVAQELHGRTDRSHARQVVVAVDDEGMLCFEVRVPQVIWLQVGLDVPVSLVGDERPRVASPRALSIVKYHFIPAGDPVEAHVHRPAMVAGGFGQAWRDGDLQGN